MAQKNIVVVGAGVSGLTTALLLSKRSDYKITVAAKHMPGDYDIEYASPWAGANYMPVSVQGTPAAEHDRNTWPVLAELARAHPEAGIHFLPVIIYLRNKDMGTAVADWFAGLLSPTPWYKDLFPDCLKNGVVFKRAVLNHISDAAVPGVHHSGERADLILNCTGLSSGKLGGVEDKAMVPARGQIVVVRNEIDTMASVSGTDDGGDEAMYIMTRAAGGGTVLGGCYQKGNWESQPDPNLAVRIMKRCVAMQPDLTQGRGIEYLDVIRHSVGLRPVREGGVRLARERINGTWVVHNYGHGGFGYQSSFGCSQEAVKLVDEAFTDRARL